MAEEHDKVAQTEKVSNQMHRSRSGFWFGIIVLLTVIFLVAILFILFYQVREEQQGLESEVNKDDAQMKELNTQLNRFSERVDNLQDQLNKLNEFHAEKEKIYNQKLADFSKLHSEKLDVAKIEISSAVNQIQRQLGKAQGDLLIADAEYLLSIANQRLHLMNDVNTTLEALNAADQRLRESGDAAVYKVREQLAKEIIEIKKISMPDIVGIYSKLQILGDNIEKLTLLLPFSGKGLTRPEDQLDEKESAKEEEEEDQELLDNIFGSMGLEDLVTIRHTDQPIDSILTAEEAYFIQQQLRVKLVMIEISLVQRNDALYQAGIKEAKNWLNEHFMMNKQAKNFNAELESLNAKVLRKQLPDISISLKMLRDVTRLRIEADKPQQNQEDNNKSESMLQMDQKDKNKSESMPQKNREDNIQSEPVSQQ